MTKAKIITGLYYIGFERQCPAGTCSGCAVSLHAEWKLQE